MNEHGLRDRRFCLSQTLSRGESETLRDGEGRGGPAWPGVPAQPLIRWGVNEIF
jgi:hypothetical protein